MKKIKRHSIFEMRQRAFALLQTLNKIPQTQNSGCNRELRLCNRSSASRKGSTAFCNRSVPVYNRSILKKKTVHIIRQTFSRSPQSICIVLHSIPSPQSLSPGRCMDTFCLANGLPPLSSGVDREKLNFLVRTVFILRL